MCLWLLISYTSFIFLLLVNFHLELTVHQQSMNTCTMAFLNKDYQHEGDTDIPLHCSGKKLFPLVTDIELVSHVAFLSKPECYHSSLLKWWREKWVWNLWNGLFKVIGGEIEKEKKRTLSIRRWVGWRRRRYNEKMTGQWGRHLRLFFKVITVSQTPARICNLLCSEWLNGCVTVVRWSGKQVARVISRDL